jgi:hypothetical protein
VKVCERLSVASNLRPRKTNVSIVPFDFEVAKITRNFSIVLHFLFSYDKVLSNALQMHWLHGAEKMKKTP